MLRNGANTRSFTDHYVRRLDLGAASVYFILYASEKLEVVSTRYCRVGLGRKSG